MQPAAKEIEELLNELEDVVRDSRTPFMGGQGMKLVDEEELLEIVDEIRVRFPTEFADARQVLHDREEMIAQAQQTADMITEDARQQAVILAGDQEVVRLAQIQANQIREDALEYDRQTRYNAEQYAESVLNQLEDSLKSLTNTVTRVRQTIEDGASSRDEW
jgi:hypothetical protein